MNTTIRPTSTSTLALHVGALGVVHLEIADRATGASVAIAIPGRDIRDRADWLVGLWEELTEFLAQWPSERQHMAEWLIASMETARKNTSKEEA